MKVLVVTMDYYYADTDVVGIAANQGAAERIVQAVIDEEPDTEWSLLHDPKGVLYGARNPGGHRRMDIDEWEVEE